MSRALNEITALAALALVIGGYAIGFAGAYALTLLALAGAYALMTLGYHLIFGRGGALSLAQGAFFALGAYTTGLLATKADLGGALTLPASMLVPALLAAAVGRPVLRLASHYFALATLSVASAVHLGVLNWQSFTGGANGLYGIPTFEAFGIALARGLPLTLGIWALVLAAAALVLVSARAGRAAQATLARETPLLARLHGIDTAALRYRQFIASAALAGAGGGAYAHVLGIISSEVAGFSLFILCLSMTVIGGRLSVFGVVAGALLLLHIPEWVRPLEEHYLLAYGALLLGCVLFLPRGLAGRLAMPGGHAPLPVAAARGQRGDLQVEGLTRSYGGVTALADVDLVFHAGEITGVIGPNGAGKTTLVNLVSGLEAADGGRVRLGDHDVSAWPAHARALAGLSRSLQTPVIPVALTGRTLLGTAAPELIDRLGLDAALDRPGGDLDADLLRKLDIARALAADPAALLLDEPAAGLAPRDRDALAELLRERARAGTAVVLIEHSMEFLLPLADRVVCLAGGRVIADGPPETVARDPEVRRAYFGETGDD